MVDERKLPEGWGIKKLGEVADIRTGKRNNQDKASDGLFPFFVRSQDVERINTYSYDGEAVLVPGEGGIGNIFHYINGKFEVHQRVYKISDFLNVSGKYVYYYMKQSFGAHAMKNTVKATVDSLRLPTFQEFELKIPNDLEEQKSIAEALSDTDNLIQSVEKLIDKKKKIKQGAMQQLLTGKKRLPGFSEEWEVKKFKDVTELITCGIAATPKYVDSTIGVPFLSSTNIKNGKIDWDDYKYISKEAHDKLYKNNPPLKGDILYSRVGTIGEAAIIESDFQFSIYVSLTLIKVKSCLHNEFLKQLLNSDSYKNLAKRTVLMGGGVGNLNVNVVREFDIPIPSLSEQKLIAQILNDMDAEIEALEEKLEKYKTIKQGMMQELLTGRIRLI